MENDHLYPQPSDRVGFFEKHKAALIVGVIAALMALGLALVASEIRDTPEPQTTGQPRR